MKGLERILEKMNDLLIMNYEVEKIYSELFSQIEEQELRLFYRERGFERNEFGKDLKLEILKLGGEPVYIKSKKGDLYKYWMNIRNFVLLEDEESLLKEIYSLKTFSIIKYNALLREMSLPLSTCKLLIKQRDSIQEGMDVLKRQEAAYVA